MSENDPMKKSALRLAHLTDLHLDPSEPAARGMEACIKHLHTLENPPQLILTGGDLVLDSFEQDAALVKTRWDAFKNLFQDKIGLPVEHCIGNHDVWGWNKAKSGTSGNEPNYGKKWAMQMLGLERPYRSFDQAGWRFIVLDSTYPWGEDSYIAKLDDEQFNWLAQELAGTPASTPILIVSHIPLVSAAAYFDGDNERTGNWQVPGAWMHIDARRIKDLFTKHPNVKLCLSGHLHLVDRVEYLGVTYFCGGAVCGAWWKGAYQECRPGYSIVDLYSDGAFRVEYQNY